MIHHSNFDQPKSPADRLSGDAPNSFCVVLGGGGARGLAHLGALRGIGEQRIAIHRMIGVSMGALMGALCVIEGCPARAGELAMQYLNSKAGQKFRTTILATGGFASAHAGSGWGAKLMREIERKKSLIRAVRSRPLLTSAVLRNVIETLIPAIDIRDLPMPFQIATVDIRSGERVILNSGSLRRAIRASMSIPGVFPAVRYQGQLLCDIGVYDSVPCDIPSNDRLVANEGTIAIDVGQSIEDEVQCQSALEAMLRFQALAEKKIRAYSLASANIVIRPRLTPTEWFDFNAPQPIIEAGYVAAKQSLQSSPAAAAINN